MPANIIPIPPSSFALRTSLPATPPDPRRELLRQALGRTHALASHIRGTLDTLARPGFHPNPELLVLPAAAILGTLSIACNLDPRKVVQQLFIPPADCSPEAGHYDAAQSREPAPTGAAPEHGTPIPPLPASGLQPATLGAPQPTAALGAPSACSDLKTQDSGLA